MMCLLAADTTVRLAAVAFTLTWIHSVERIPWEEDWRIVGDLLVPVESRVRGSGAGMEPGPGARLEGGTWRWRPEVPPRSELVLARSEAAEDWWLCVAAQPCRPLASFLPDLAPDTPVRLRSCR
ncbi:MAG: DUF1850 domain-containing protein [Geminicoccaceae bacterium]|nr:DUF1850 domain-containing protein [Geminicoccaceae bacterium]MCX8100351.1 DUF1850 domain-containing protein [Geminicoccaceae bacterium]MDW8368842.1 DUF1850 domain-containing protein [Geminicoccaceae bacterium]